MPAVANLLLGLKFYLCAQFSLCLLTGFMLGQSTLISYHTEAFVKTEVGCTVKYEHSINSPLFLIRLRIPDEVVVAFEPLLYVFDCTMRQNLDF